MKTCRWFILLLVITIVSLFVFFYIYNHLYGPAGFSALKNDLVGFVALIIILCWFSFSNKIVRWLAIATAISLLIWIASIQIDRQSSSFLFCLFVKNPPLLPIFLFTVFLSLTIIFALKPFKNYRYVCYCIVSLIGFGLFSLVGIPALSLAYLHHSYEIAPVSEIAKIQQKEGGYYVPLHAEYQYKLALYQIRKPAVVVIGTSRVLGYYQYMFHVPFVNMGRTLGNFATLQTFKDMLAIHRPKVIIWGVDWWDLVNAPVKVWQGRQYDGTEIIPVDLLLPFQWIFEGKITIREFLATAFGQTVNHIDHQSYGVQARHRIRGYANDGGMYYFSDIKNIIQKRTVQFAVDKNTILTTVPKAGYFQAANEVPSYKWSELKAIQSLLAKNHVKLIMFIAPEPPAIVNAMQQTTHYHYLEALKSHAYDFGPYYYDYWDAKKIDATDCEFIDSLHSGDIVAMRVLMQMSQDHANGLYQLINSEKIKNLVSQYAGRTSVPIAGILPDKETDFLGLGCQKGKSWHSHVI